MTLLHFPANDNRVPEDPELVLDRTVRLEARRVANLQIAEIRDWSVICVDFWEQRGRPGKARAAELRAQKQIARIKRELIAEPSAKRRTNG